MASKIGVWLLVKIGEALARKAKESGGPLRTRLIDYLIVRAEKAKLNKTSADDDILGMWADFMKSERLKEALR